MMKRNRVNQTICILLTLLVLFQFPSVASGTPIENIQALEQRISKVEQKLEVVENKLGIETQDQTSSLSPEEETKISEETVTKTNVLATWNINNLTKNNERNKDIAQLREYAARIEADVMALQEVETASLVEKVLGDKYNISLTNHGNYPQKVGFAVRKEIPVQENPDYTALDVGGLRYGKDITINPESQFPLRLLSLHLKSYCWDDPLSTNNRDCQKLSKQITLIEDWIEDREREGVAFAVLGDFNRRFNDANDDAWTNLDDRSPDLITATAGKTSQCFNQKYPSFIDHIIVEESSTHLTLIPETFTQYLYHAPESQIYNLSDHCAISVGIALTDQEETESDRATGETDQEGTNQQGTECEYESDFEEKKELLELFDRMKVLIESL